MTIGTNSTTTRPWAKIAHRAHPPLLTHTNGMVKKQECLMTFRCDHGNQHASIIKLHAPTKKKYLLPSFPLSFLKSVPSADLFPAFIILTCLIDCNKKCLSWS